MNLIDDYTNQNIKLNDDYEGEVKAVLTTSKRNTGNRKGVLYLHGYIDYFFQEHLGEKFNRNNFDFFALDLRKHGRALLPNQHPNYCKDIKEYFEEISISIRKIKSENNPLFFLAHSTGGLTASCYMNEGKERNCINGLILNSPFLDFNQSKIEKSISQFAAKLISKVSSYAKIEGVLSPAYAKSIHKDYYGEWDFNLNWKPVEGFPTYFKWVIAIARAQNSLRQSNIQVPILIMHSSKSIKIKRYSKKAMTHDIVLDIEDIKKVGKKLGNKVKLVEIQNAQHDIFLSPKPVRENGFDKMFAWLSNNEFEK